MPTYTFVRPERYQEILVSVRTPGRCCVIEGPSGIGKTTVIARVLAELGLERDVLKLSAREPKDVELITALPDMGAIGTVIVDDFHRLAEDVKARLGDFMKLLADREAEEGKLILLGINKTGEQLIKLAHDLGLRLDVFKLEANPVELLERVIELGEAEDALNVEIPGKQEVAERSYGSFQLVQLICNKLCVLDGVLETQVERRVVRTSVNVAVENVLQDLARQFRDVALTFARGSKLRREGRAPYLHILRWLADGDDWSIDLSQAMNEHPELKGSISQVIEKGHLRALLNDPEKAKLLQPYFHYQDTTMVLSVEDPKLVFFLKNLVWRAFTRQVGFRVDYFRGKYDVAFSFAGANRNLAKRLFEVLVDREVSVFYDENEQHRILSQNVEDYLAPIYRSEARYVIVLQSPEYPTRIWTKFESDVFRERFGTNDIIPIRYRSVAPGFFTEDAKYGGVAFDPNADFEQQAQYIADLICNRLIEDRNASAAAEQVEAVAAAEPS